jgi:hypothetical protein
VATTRPVGSAAAMSLNWGRSGRWLLLWPRRIGTSLGDGVVAARRGAVEADLLDGELVDLAGRLPEPGLEVGADRGGGEATGRDGQAGIGELGVAARLADQAFEGGPVAVGPVADGRLAVIGLREDVGGPDGGDPARREPPMEMMAAESLAEDPGELQAAGRPEDQGDVVDPLVVQSRGVRHEILRRRKGRSPCL